MFTAENFAGYSSTKNYSNITTATDSNHDKANVITTTIGGGLSMLGVIFIVVSYFRLVHFRAGGTTAQTILIFISTVDFMAAASNVVSVWLGPHIKNLSCKAGGFIIIFATTASFFWTSCMTFHLYLIILNKNHLVSHTKKMLIFHLISWGLPLIFAFTALGGNALGHSPSLEGESNIKLTTGGWCWIKKFGSKKETIWWTMMTSKFWELSSYLLITVLCCLIMCQLRWKLKTTDGTIGEDTLVEARKAERRMLFIPVAFILLRVWGTVRYFAYLSELSVRTSVLKNMTLYALQGLGDSGQGFANSVFFCISNKRVYQYWKYTLSNYLPDFLCYNSDSDTSERSPLLDGLCVNK